VLDNMALRTGRGMRPLQRLAFWWALWAAAVLRPPLADNHLRLYDGCFRLGLRCGVATDNAALVSRMLRRATLLLPTVLYSPLNVAHTLGSRRRSVQDDGYVRLHCAWSAAQRTRPRLLCLPYIARAADAGMFSRAWQHLGLYRCKTCSSSSLPAAGTPHSPLPLLLPPTTTAARLLFGGWMPVLARNGLCLHRTFKVAALEDYTWALLTLLGSGGSARTMPYAISGLDLPLLDAGLPANSGMAFLSLHLPACRIFHFLFPPRSRRRGGGGSWLARGYRQAPRTVYRVLLLHLPFRLRLSMFFCHLSSTVLLWTSGWMVLLRDGLPLLASGIAGGAGWAFAERRCLPAGLLRTATAAPSSTAFYAYGTVG